ncbi:SAV_915 family protein [Streptomyces sp. NRRL S-15]|uniref:SAV_915 family protein n=1 Tax=Streptomyces sp. NRRL S-15 TaxID=1463886 RepID=UPI0004C7C98F|nr:SAV_915 family protein [Streptomyces sp. NRRL S-15]
MCLFQYDDDPDPEEQAPAGLLYVPVRPGAAGPALRMFRTPLGERTAVGFTRQDLLSAALGAGQSSIRLSEPALRSLAAPLGVDRLVLDPVLSAPSVTAEPVHTAEEPVRSL